MAKKKAETVDKPVSDKARKEALLTRAKDRYKVLEEYWADNRKAAVEAIKFAAGDQWPQPIKEKREKANRPALVLDKLSQYRRQVVNDGRQNRPTIKFRPVDDGGDIKVAEAFQGLTRSILAKSNADEAFDTALDHACGHGFGYFRVLTDYAYPGSFEQEISVKRVRNSISVLLAPHQCADGSDAEDGFVEDQMPKSAFEAKWPNAEKVKFAEFGDDYGDGWLDENTVKVVEYFYKEPTEKTVYLLEDGTTVDKEAYDKALLIGPQPAMVKSRLVRSNVVKWCRMTGAEILEEGEWAGEYIPIVPVYGTETDINGKVTYSGLTKPGMHGQMLYNFARTAFAERVALTPKAPWVAAVGQTEDNPDWQTANEENHSVLTYNPVDINGQVQPPPQRQSAADIPAGFAQEMQQAEHDIQSALGMYAASLGQQSNEKSGRAIMARQREGDVATFHYHDNLNRAIRHLGRILLDLIPKIYDTKRVVRLLNEDGTTKDAMVAPGLGMPSAKVDGMEIFDLSAGHYDVETMTGPSFTTKRQESSEAMIELAKGNPNVWMTHGDLIVKAQDWPGADDFAKRTRATMPPPLQQAIAQSEQEGDDPQAQQMQMQLQQMQQQAQQAIQEREQALQQMQAQMQQMEQEAKSKDDDRALKARELEIKAYEAKTARMQALQPVMPPEAIAQVVMQTLAQLQTPGQIDQSQPMPDMGEQPPDSGMPMMEVMQ